MAVTALFVHRDLAFHGGVPRSFYTVACHRDTARLHMQVASFQQASEQLTLDFCHVGVPVHHLGNGYLQSVRLLRRLVRTRGLDVIVCGSFRSLVVARAAALRQPCAVVFWVPAIPIMKGHLRRGVFRLLALNIDLIFISQAVANAHSYRYHRGRKDVLYHGISDHLSDIIPTGSTDIRAELNLSADTTLIGYVAEFTPWKDHSTLMHAFNAIADRHADLHLLLIGTGSTISPNRRLASSLRHGNRVHFLGAREDVRALYPQMDIYAHPADGEGFGLAVAEAMLAGLPVVAADAGALPELVHDGTTGLLFAPHDAADLSRKLLRLADNSELRLEFGGAARRHCLDRFDPDRFAREMTCLLEQAAKQTSPRASVS
jgi:glycosyltransferase involved in cell wall biosynthesis